MHSSVKRLLLPGPGPRTIPRGLARGIRINVDFEHHLGLYLGLYELELERHIRRLCRPGSAAFDIGGSFGYDALALANLGARLVLTAEPDPESMRRLRANVALNPELGCVRMFEGAVGTGSGMTSLDELAAQQFKPEFIKVDVDGGEVDVLLGAQKTLASGLRGVIVETHSFELENECGALLQRAGYQVTVVHQRRVLPDYRPIAHNRWLVAEPA